MFQIISKMRDVVDADQKPKEWEMVFYYTVWVDIVQYTNVFYKNFSGERHNKIKFFIKLYTDSN